VIAAAPKDILDAFSNRKWFGSQFRFQDEWTAWRSFLAAAFGLPMSEDEAEIYTACTGRAERPTTRAKEVWAICGRRSGKTNMAGFVATYLASFVDWTPYLAAGERAHILIVSATKESASVALDYIRGLLTDHPMLRDTIKSETRDSIELTNRVVIRVTAANARAGRGFSAACIICDEVSQWRADDGSVTDANEVLRALRPSMLNLPGSMLLVLSTPAGKTGPLWKTYREHFGKEGDSILLWSAPTLRMNPSLPLDIEAEMKADPVFARREYLAEFVEGGAFITRDEVEACVVEKLYVRHNDHVQRYVAFCDPAGGSVGADGSGDAMSLAIAHKEGNACVLDLLDVVQPPFQPSTVIRRFAGILERYGLRKVTGDKFGGDWPSEAFAKRGIFYQRTDRPKSDLYLALGVKLRNGEVDLVDSKLFDEELCNLTRKVMSGGREKIDHPRHGSDDAANAVAGAVVLASLTEGTAQTVSVPKYGKGEGPGVQGYSIPVGAPGWRAIGIADDGGPTDAPPGGWPADSPMGRALRGLGGFCGFVVK
jgi:hypothetical protein